MALPDILGNLPNVVPWIRRTTFAGRNALSLAASFMSLILNFKIKIEIKIVNEEVYEIPVL